jgi:thioredoxin-dependent peroxiredoxin
MTHLKAGFPAPGFQLADQNGNQRSLADFRGKNLVLFFYPHDDDPTAVGEARAFAQQLQQFRQARAEVVGVCVDDAAKHQTLAQKNQIKYPLLSDPQRKAINAYGVSRGDAAGPEAFLIDPEGKIVRTYTNTTAKQVPQILNDVRHMKK